MTVQKKSKRRKQTRTRRFYVSIGSNIHPGENIPACLRLLRSRFDVRRQSSVYETPPEGPSGTRNFWNTALEIRTSLTRREFLTKLRGIEKVLGRKRECQNKYAPRTIDLDLFKPSRDEKLSFVMIPLAEIAPGSQSPYSRQTFAQIARKFRKQARHYKKIARAAAGREKQPAR